MSRIEIVNRTQKRFVINSLNMVIGPHNPNKPILRDHAIKSDPDICELVHSGMLSLVEVADPKLESIKEAPSSPSKNQNVSTNEASKQGEQSKQSKQGKGKRKYTSKKSHAEENVEKKKRGSKAVTYFNPTDSSDQMGGKVVIMGEKGPQISKMQPGMNAHEGPKFIGDIDVDDDAEAEDLDGKDQNSVFRKIT